VNQRLSLLSLSTPLVLPVFLAFSAPAQSQVVSANRERTIPALIAAEGSESFTRGATALSEHNALSVADVSNRFPEDYPDDQPVADEKISAVPEPLPFSLADRVFTDLSFTDTSASKGVDPSRVVTDTHESSQGNSAISTSAIDLLTDNTQTLIRLEGASTFYPVVTPSTDETELAQSIESNSAQDGGNAQAEANNPLANITAVNFQNYYIGDFTGPAGDGNQFVLRIGQPVKLFNSPWLVRLSVPVNTFPTASLDTKTGLGDINLFATALIDIGDPQMSFGVGPQITMPTATETNTGSDKWSLGLASIFFDGRSPKFQYGGLLTYQHSIGGNPNRATVNGAAFQPFGFY